MEVQEDSMGVEEEALHSFWLRKVSI